MEINLQLWILAIWETVISYMLRDKCMMVCGFQTTERNHDNLSSLCMFFIMEGWQKTAADQNGCFIYSALVKQLYKNSAESVL